MATLSRTKKYQDLRNRLQQDTNADALSTNDLSRFKKRLNEIDSQNFSYTENASSDSHNAEHARNLNTQPQQQTQQPLRRHQQTQDKDPFANVSFSANENNDVTFDNDYLDQYIREVKQYNIDQGNAASENTSLNILKQIERNNSATPEKPYPSSNSHTADIPFLSSQSSSNRYPQDVKQSSSSQENTQPTQAMSKEDIMQEVQNLVNGTSSSYTQPEETSSPFVNDYESKNDSFMSTDTFNRRLEADRTTRQQLLNETTQMRAQLDDYEDNLSEVSDKMRQTNRILNIVLVILIIALAMIVGVVIYWIITSK